MVNDSLELKILPNRISTLDEERFWPLERGAVGHVYGRTTRPCALGDKGSTHFMERVVEPQVICDAQWSGLEQNPVANAEGIPTKGLAPRQSRVGAPTTHYAVRG